MLVANSYSIPIDLTIEILSRLPAKSIARFSCVSKLWRSMLGRPYFKDLFLARSSARPRLLFAVERYNGDWCFFSSPQLQNPYEKWTSLVVSADCHMTLRGQAWLQLYCHASGLISYHRFLGTIRQNQDQDQVIYNPSTGEYALLPKVRTIGTRAHSFLGFDPIDKQFKVLSINIPRSSGEIFTLGSGDDSWREIHCPLNHRPLNEGICINGVLYYFAKEDDENRPSLIVCFDVTCEKFKFIYRDFMSSERWIRMINYKGKLGVITLEYSYDYNIWELNRGLYNKSKDRKRSLKLCMWVIQHAEKPESEWSEYVYTFRKDKVDGCNSVPTLWEDQVVGGDFTVVGATATGEIVLSTAGASNPFYVFYLSPESNTLQRVEIRGLGAANHEALEKRNRRVRVFVDHVEDLKFVNNMKTADASTRL